MTRITVSDAVVGTLGQSLGEAEVYDAAGHRLGYSLSDEAYRRLVCQWANTQVTDEELDRCRHEPEGYSTAEILQRLQALS